jgi:ubiquinone/menaquinone biosynthesis C-methylase UbiE
VTGSEYLHGYATAEQERLIAQAEHWREDLILAGTHLPAGTRLLEVGCGVGAVLGILGGAFPGIRITGVDIEQRQLDFAAEHLAALGLEADLRQADALALPFGDGSFDQVWMMWFLEHLDDPVAALREARRVLVPGGAITAIEADYNTTRATPETPAIRALFRAMAQGMDASGRSDAGTHVARWLEEAGFQDVDPGEHDFDFSGRELVRQARYVVEVMQGVVPALAELPGAADEAELRAGLADLLRLPEHEEARLGWAVQRARGAA